MNNQDLPAEKPSGSAGARWTDREDRYISTHRMDGYVLIAEGLSAIGPGRTPDAVRMHAWRKLRIALAKYPAGGMRKCIVCGRWYARPNTRAGKSGFCPSCWERRKAEAYEEATDELDSIRAYHRARKYRRTHGVKGREHGKRRDDDDR